LSGLSSFSEGLDFLRPGDTGRLERGLFAFRRVREMALDTLGKLLAVRLRPSGQLQILRCLRGLFRTLRGFLDFLGQRSELRECLRHGSSGGPEVDRNADDLDR